MGEGDRPEGPRSPQVEDRTRPAGQAARALLVALAAATGLGLMTDSLWRSSATYDEVMYLQVAARWWRTGDQTRITRAGHAALILEAPAGPGALVARSPGLRRLDRRPGRASKPSSCPWHGRRQCGSGWRPSGWWSTGAAGCTGRARWCWRPGGSRSARTCWLTGRSSPWRSPILATITGMAFFFWQFLRTGSRRRVRRQRRRGRTGVLLQVHGGAHAADLRPAVADPTMDGRRAADLRGWPWPWPRVWPATRRSWASPTWSSRPGPRCRSAGGPAIIRRSTAS